MDFSHSEVIAMVFVKRYLIPRLVQYVLVIWLGITVVFLIPRIIPNDPVMSMIGMMRARGSTLEPGAMDGIIHDLTEMYGLAWGRGPGRSPRRTPAGPRSPSGI